MQKLQNKVFEVVDYCLHAFENDSSAIQIEIKDSSAYVTRFIF